MENPEYILLLSLLASDESSVVLYIQVMYYVAHFCIPVGPTLRTNNSSTLRLLWKDKIDRPSLLKPTSLRVLNE